MPKIEEINAFFFTIKGLHVILIDKFRDSNIEQVFDLIC